MKLCEPILCLAGLLAACAGSRTGGPPVHAALPAPVVMPAITWDAAANTMTCRRTKTKLALPEPWHVKVVSDDEVHARDGEGAVVVIRSDPGSTGVELLGRDLAATHEVATGAVLEDGRMDLRMNGWHGRATYTTGRPGEGEFLLTFAVPSGDRAWCRIFVLEPAVPARGVGATLLQGLADPAARSPDTQPDSAAAIMRALESSRPTGAPRAGRD